MYRILASKSAPLYHGTTWKNAIDIIESNELRANISNETETYGISFTRNKDSAYDQIGIVIDQEKLSYNYKIDPIYRDGISGKDLAEERVPKTIKNIRNYIIELRLNNPVYKKSIQRILVDNFDQDNLLDSPYLVNKRKPNVVYWANLMIDTADKYGIPIDKDLQYIKKYIDMYVDRVFDNEYANILQSRRRK